MARSATHPPHAYLTERARSDARFTPANERIASVTLATHRVFLHEASDQKSAFYTVPASVAPSNSSLICLDAQHITCKHTVAHEQLNTEPSVVHVVRRGAFGRAFWRSDRGAPTQHATAPAASTKLLPVTSLMRCGWRREPPVESPEPFCGKPG